MSIVVTPLIEAPKDEWLATTRPILLDRLVYESDTGNFKIGDGVSMYSQLPYFNNLTPASFLILAQLADISPFDESVYPYVNTALQNFIMDGTTLATGITVTLAGGLTFTPGTDGQPGTLSSSINGSGTPYLPLSGGMIIGNLSVQGTTEVATASPGDNSNNAASTAFVHSALSSAVNTLNTAINSLEISSDVSITSGTGINVVENSTNHFTISSTVDTTVTIHSGTGINVVANSDNDFTINSTVDTNLTLTEGTGITVTDNGSNNFTIENDVEINAGTGINVVDNGNKSFTISATGGSSSNVTITAGNGINVVEESENDYVISATGQGSAGGGGSVALWQPGAPILADWTPVNGEFVNSYLSVNQNGSNSVAITCVGQPGNGGLLQFGGFMITPPTAPYKILLGFSTMPTGFIVDIAPGDGDSQGGSNTTQGPTSAVYSGLTMGVGWSNGNAAVWYSPGINTYTLYTPGAMVYFENNTNYGTIPLTDTVTSLQAPAIMEFILSDDGAGNITLSETQNGYTEHVLWTASKASLTNVDGTTFDNICILFGSTDGNLTADGIGGSITSLFLYDPAVANRSPVAPAY